MAKKITNCELCGIYPAVQKDYRTFDGMTSKFLVCRWCAGLNDVTIADIRNKKEDPLVYYEEIEWEDIPFEELSEINNAYYDEIKDELSDNYDFSKKLKFLVESERELALREEDPR